MEREREREREREGGGDRLHDVMLSRAWQTSRISYASMITGYLPCSLLQSCGYVKRTSNAEVNQKYLIDV